VTDVPIDLSRCETCRARFLPTDGPCPRCGSPEVRSYPSPSIGTVLASTEMSNPPTGWNAPHRIALVELPESVRLIAIVEGPLPAPGAVVAVRVDGPVYRATSEPAT
jgi:uncharacterized OB-fold protein